MNVYRIVQRGGDNIGIRIVAENDEAAKKYALENNNEIYYFSLLVCDVEIANFIGSKKSSHKERLAVIDGG